MKKFVAGMVVAVVLMVGGALSAEPIMEKLNEQDEQYLEQVEDWNSIGQ